MAALVAVALFSMPAMARDRAFETGISMPVTEGWTAGLTVGALSESPGQPGTSYSDERVRFGVGLSQQNAISDGDRLSISAHRSVRAYSGPSAMTRSLVDDDGYVSTTSQRASLIEQGDRTDIGMSYRWQMNDVEWRASVDFRQDDAAPVSSEKVFRIGTTIPF
jgi:hypothetical protein